MQNVLIVLVKAFNCFMQNNAILRSRLIASKNKCFYLHDISVCTVYIHYVFINTHTYSKYLKSSFPKRYKSIWIVFMKMTFFYLDPYILLIFNLSC